MCMLQETCMTCYGKGIGELTNEEIYVALLKMTKELSSKKESGKGKKKSIIFLRNF